jgi:hypothetical protein
MMESTMGTAVGTAIGTMTVERRYSARHPIDLKVQVLYHGRRFLGAQGLNLSNQGMYLGVNHVTLPVGTLVELEMECLGQEWLVEAAVVHHDQRGVGVKFSEPQPALYQGLTRQAGAMPLPPTPGRDRPHLLPRG